MHYSNSKLSPHIILEQLNNHVDDLTVFSRLVSYFYSNQPLTMLNDENIKNYITSTEWFSEPEAFIITFRSFDRSINSNRLLRYMGSIITDDEFWYKVASIDISFAKYYNATDDAFKTYVSLME